MVMTSVDDEVARWWWCWRYLQVDDELFTSWSQTEPFFGITFVLLTQAKFRNRKQISLRPSQHYTHPRPLLYRSTHPPSGWLSLYTAGVTV